MRLEIITKKELNDKQKELLEEFNGYYDNWVYSNINGYTYTEMQNKLLYLMDYILETIKKNKGLLQLCKIKPGIKLRYYENEETIEDFEVISLHDMLMNCIFTYTDVFEEDDFEMDNEELIMSNNERLERKQQILCEYQDITEILSTLEDEDEDEDE